MKGNGLSSTSRNVLKKATKRSAYASHQVGYLAAREKQKSLRHQAARAEADRAARFAAHATVEAGRARTDARDRSDSEDPSDR